MTASNLYLLTSCKSVDFAVVIDLNAAVDPAISLLSSPNYDFLLIPKKSTNTTILTRCTPYSTVKININIQTTLFPKNISPLNKNSNNIANAITSYLLV